MEGDENSYIFSTSKADTILAHFYVMENYQCYFILNKIEMEALMFAQCPRWSVAKLRMETALPIFHFAGQHAPVDYILSEFTPLLLIIEKWNAAHWRK